MAVQAVEVINAARRSAADRARSSDSVPPGNRGANAGRGRAARQGGPQPTVWIVLAIGAAIGLVALVTSGTVREGTLLALLAFVVIGAIAPAVAIPVGAVILVATFFRGDVSSKFFGWLGGLGSAPNPASQPSSVSGNLDPTVYLPSKTIGAA